MTDLTQLTDDDLDRLRVAVRAEQEARSLAKSAPSSAAAVVDAVTSGLARDPITVRLPDGSTYTLAVQRNAVEADGPDEWVPDTAYTSGAEVTYEGRRYKAVQDTTGSTPPPDAASVWQAL